MNQPYSKCTAHKRFQFACWKRVAAGKYRPVDHLFHYLPIKWCPYLSFTVFSSFGYKYKFTIGWQFAAVHLLAYSTHRAERRRAGHIAHVCRQKTPKPDTQYGGIWRPRQWLRFCTNRFTKVYMDLWCVSSIAYSG